MTRRTFGFTAGLRENLTGNLSGIYHVRETELNQGQDKDTFLKRTKLTQFSSSIRKPVKLVQCNIKFLDNTSHTFEIDVSELFKFLFINQNLNFDYLMLIFF